MSGNKKDIREAFLGEKDNKKDIEVAGIEMKMEPLSITESENLAEKIQKKQLEGESVGIKLILEKVVKKVYDKDGKRVFNKTDVPEMMKRPQNDEFVVGLIEHFNEINGFTEIVEE